MKRAIPNDCGHRLVRFHPLLASIRRHYFNLFPLYILNTTLSYGKTLNISSQFSKVSVVYGGDTDNNQKVF